MAELLSAELERAVTGWVAQAEQGSEGEVVVVVAPRSSTYDAERGRVSATCTVLAAVAAYWLLPSVSPLWILCGQAPLLVTLWSLGAVGRVARSITTEAARARAVRAAAARAFLEHGVTDTQGRSGVLLYLSELERRIELVADRGIHERVGDERWQQLVAQASRSLAASQPALALQHTLSALGELLRQHFPSPGATSNELPDAPRAG